MSILLERGATELHCNKGGIIRQAGLLWTLEYKSRIYLDEYAPTAKSIPLLGEKFSIRLGHKIRVVQREANQSSESYPVEIPPVPFCRLRVAPSISVEVPRRYLMAPYDDRARAEGRAETEEMASSYNLDNNALKAFCDTVQILQSIIATKSQEITRYEEEMETLLKRLVAEKNKPNRDALDFQTRIKELENQLAILEDKRSADLTQLQAERDRLKVERDKWKRAAEDRANTLENRTSIHVPSQIPQPSDHQNALDGSELDRLRRLVNQQQLEIADLKHISALNHIQRDVADQTVGDSDFPTGHKLRQMYIDVCRRGKTFFIDLISAMKDSRKDKERLHELGQYMKNIFELASKTAKQRIDAKVSVLQKSFGVKEWRDDPAVQRFMLTTMQRDEYRSLMSSLKQAILEDIGSPTMYEFHQLISRLRTEDREALDESSRTFVIDVYRRFAEMHFVCELSDPRCELSPSPHTIVTQDLADSASQIPRSMSASAEHILLLPALYFWNSNSTAAAVKSVAVKGVSYCIAAELAPATLSRQVSDAETDRGALAFSASVVDSTDRPSIHVTPHPEAIVRSPSSMLRHHRDPPVQPPPTLIAEDVKEDAPTQVTIQVDPPFGRVSTARIAEPVERNFLNLTLERSSGRTVSTVLPRHYRPPRRLVGLSNLGFTCYMSSVLQCLAHAPPFEYPATSATKSTSGELTGSLRSLLNEMCSARSAYDIRSLRQVHNCMTTQYPTLFPSHMEHDAFTLLRSVIQQLQKEQSVPEEIRAKSRGPNRPSRVTTQQEMAEEAWTRFRQRVCSPVLDAITYLRRTTHRCTHCQHCTYNFEPNNALILPIPTAEDLATMIPTTAVPSAPSREVAEASPPPPAEEERLSITLVVYLLGKRPVTFSLVLSPATTAITDLKRLVLEELVRHRLRKTSSLHSIDEVHFHFSALEEVPISSQQPHCHLLRLANTANGTASATREERLVTVRDILGTSQCGVIVVSQLAHRAPIAVDPKSRGATFIDITFGQLFSNNDINPFPFCLPIRISFASPPSEQTLVDEALGVAELLLPAVEDGTGRTRRRSFLFDYRYIDADFRLQSGVPKRRTPSCIFGLRMLRKHDFTRGEEIHFSVAYPLAAEHDLQSGEQLLALRPRLERSLTQATSRNIPVSPPPACSNTPSRSNGVGARSNSNGNSTTGFHLQQAFELYSRPRPRTGGQCDNCQQHNTMQISFDLWQAPELLVVSLVRFQVNPVSQRLTKRDDVCHFPIDDFDMTALESIHQARRDVGTGSGISNGRLSGGTSKQAAPSSPSTSRYDLYGIVEHLGSTCDSGHYTAYCRVEKEEPQQPHQWYCFDDTVVSPCTPHEFHKDRAYLLFYVRRPEVWT